MIVGLSSVNHENGVASDCMHCFSTWGDFKGDMNHMSLDLKIGENEVHMNFVPNGEILYNGGTGLIHFGNTGSYQYSFPNMGMEGTFILQGHTYKVKNAHAWFDRQYGLLSTRPKDSHLLRDKVVGFGLVCHHSRMAGAPYLFGMCMVQQKSMLLEHFCTKTV